MLKTIILVGGPVDGKQLIVNELIPNIFVKSDEIPTPIRDHIYQLQVEQQTGFAICNDEHHIVYRHTGCRVCPR